MTTLRRFLTILALLAGTVDRAQAQAEYEIDSAQTSLVFAISHFNLSYTYGRFDKVAGEFTLDGDVADSFRFTIDAASIDTNQEERDKHLRSPDFLDAKQFPEIRFESTRIDRADDDFNVVGNLTILGTTREITIPVRLVGIGKGPFGKDRAGFFAKFTIKRSDFGMNNMLPEVGNNIAITFSFEGIKKTSDP